MLRRLSCALLLAAVAAGCGDDGSGPTGNDASGVVSGRVFLDRNDDGVYGAGDAALAGVRTSLIANATGDTVARAESVTDGTFVLRSVPAGSYRLAAALGALADSLVVRGGDATVTVETGDTTVAHVQVGFAALRTTVLAARGMPPGQQVMLFGVALTGTTTFGDSTVHLMDATGFVRVLQTRGVVVAGDSVRIVGTVATVNGQPAIAPATAAVLRPGVTTPVPDSVSTVLAATAQGGSRDAAPVRIAGMITGISVQTNGDRVLAVDDGSGPVDVVLDAAIVFPQSVEVGTELRLSGVLISAGGGRWRVYPRGGGELAIITGTIRCENGTAGAYPCRGVDLLAHIPVAALGGQTNRLNDIWGWTDPVTGKEYAIVGRTDGTAFVDISDPVRPVLVANLFYTAGSRVSTWRDMKVYKDHAFIVADGALQHGMQVVDLTRLRAYAGAVLQLTPAVVYTQIASAHNIVINEQSGFAYAVGSSSGGQTCGGGLHMIDIREPKSPQFAGCFSHVQTGRSGTGYTHDAQCVMYAGPDTRYTDREICFGSNETALSIADVTVKSAPVALSQASYPSVAYSHQGWLSEDQRFLFMNDELDEGRPGISKTRTLVWDVSDLGDPQLVAQHNGVEASTDHNLYIRGNLMYQANYTSGLRILDVSNRTAPVEVGFFDTTPTIANTPGFSGAWSSYPYFASGVIVVSSIHEGLFILRQR